MDSFTLDFLAVNRPFCWFLWPRG